jgi:hypothetical protein
VEDSAGRMYSGPPTEDEGSGTRTIAPLVPQRTTGSENRVRSGVKRRCGELLETLEKLAEDGSVNEHALLQLSKKLKAVHDADSMREIKIRRDIAIEYAIGVPHSLGEAPDDVDWFSVKFVNLLVRRKRQWYEKIRTPGLNGQDLADALEGESARMIQWLANLVDFYLGDGFDASMLRVAAEMLLEADSDTFEAPIKFHLETEVTRDAEEVYADHPGELDWLLELAPSLSEWACKRGSGSEAGDGAREGEAKAPQKSFVAEREPVSWLAP